MKRALILAFRATLVLICLCLAHAAEPTEIADAKLPSGVNLDWGKASITAVNTKRAQINLNGIWRFAPASEGSSEPPKAGWAYIKVPGSWQSSRNGSTDFVAKGKGPAWDLFDGTRVSRAWYERQVRIPNEWQGRAISLRFERVCTDSIVYVNGKECGKIAWPWGSVDITPAVTPGQIAIVRVLVAAILPLLVAEAGSASQKARYDFWLTIGELVAQNYFGQIQEWCSKHHLRSGGHLLSEENIVTHVPFYGDFFRCIRRLDAPSIDILTSLPPEVPWYIARLLASAAELEGKTLVMSETSDHSQRYRPAGDKRAMRVVTEDEIRGTCNRIFVGGVNTITSYYSYADLSDDQLRRLNEWVGRCCLMLRGGHQVADIAVLYPVESIRPCFVPSRQWANDAAVAARIENTYRSVSETLFAARRDFTYVDSRAMITGRIGSILLMNTWVWFPGRMNFFGPI